MNDRPLSGPVIRIDRDGIGFDASHSDIKRAWLSRRDIAAYLDATEGRGIVTGPLSSDNNPAIREWIMDGTQTA